MKFNVRLNSALSVAETVVNGLTLFALYAYVNRRLGIGNVGVWAMIVATGSLTRVADMGVGQGLQRKIAVALATEDSRLAVAYVEAAFIAVGALYALLLAVAYYPAMWALEAALPAAEHPVIGQLLPITFASLWMSQLAWLALFGLCGTHRVYLKCIVSMAGNLVNLTAAILLVPRLGLMGLAAAQISQAVVAALAGMVLLKQVLPGTRWFPSRITLAVLRDLLAYGWKLQVVAVLVLACDPVTKLLLGRFFGTVMVGLYELASRMVQQVRLLIVAPNNALVPTLAALGYQDPARCAAVLRRAQRITNFLGTAVGAALVGLLPIVSEIWIGHFSAVFVAMGALYTLGSFANLYTAPLYYLGIASDRFRWVLTGHIVMVVLNAGLCLWSGIAGSALWLTAAAAAASISASAIWLFGISSQADIPLAELYGNGLPSLAIAAVLAVGSSWFLYARLRAVCGLWLTGVAELAAIGGTFLLGLAIHPDRRMLFKGLFGYLSRPAALIERE